MVEEVQTTRWVGRSPLQWVLANGETPSAIPTFKDLVRHVEGLNEARTPLADFFSVLLEAVSPSRHMATFQIQVDHPRKMRRNLWVVCQGFLSDGAIS